jgi:Domain of unknown function (DUF4166)
MFGDAVSLDLNEDLDRLESPGDQRFCRLLHPRDWAALPIAIRRRFSKHRGPRTTIVYAGEVLETWMSRAGWLIAQALRTIGAPLPTSRCVHVPSVVIVTGDTRTSSQIWTRLYARRAGFPQIVHSFKRFGGPTGLEEYLGYGISMALTLHVVDDTLVFRSRGYFLTLIGWRLRLPAFLSPGALSITHAELPDGKFSFTLELVHPRWGLLIRQLAIYREVAS